jgi:hypothetical protein
MAFERVLLDLTDTDAFTGFTDAFGFADPLLLLLKGLKGLGALLGALFTFGLGALLGALFTLIAEAETEAAEVILMVSPGFIVYSRTTGILFIRNKI